MKDFELTNNKQADSDEQTKMLEAEQKFKLEQADKTVKQLTDKKSKTNKFGYLFLALTVVVLVVIAVVEFNNNQDYPLSLVLQTWGDHWYFLAIALLSMILSLFFDGFRQTVLLKGATGKWRFKLTFKSMILGRYFDNITPSAIGGQPYQIYYLHKHKVPAGIATSLPVVCFFMQQFAFCVIAIVSLIVYGPIVESIALQIAIYFGTFCMIAMPLAIMISAFIPKTSKKILHGIIFLLHKIRIVKNVEAVTYKFDHYLDDYSNSLKIIGGHKKTLIFSFLIALACQLLNYSVVYFIVLASGHSEPWFYVIALVAFTQASCSFIPTPGSSGAMEGAFILVFSALSSGFLFWSMLLWRLITFYMPTMTGLGVLINNTIKENSYRRRGLFRESFDDDDKNLTAR